MKRSERLKIRERESWRAKMDEKLEENLARIVKEFDLDYDPPYAPKNKLIQEEYAIEKYPNLLSIFPNFYQLSEEQQTNAVLILKFKLDRRLSLKDGPAIQRAIAIVLDKKIQGSAPVNPSVSPEVYKFKR